MRSLGHKHTPSNVAESERGLEPCDGSCLLPTPTNKEHSQQPGKTTGRITGASGTAGSVFVSYGFPSISLLPSSRGRGHVQTTTLQPKGLVCVAYSGDHLSVPY